MAYDVISGSEFPIEIKDIEIIAVGDHGAVELAPRNHIDLQAEVEHVGVHVPVAEITHQQGIGTSVKVGVALTAVASKFLFNEPFTWVMAAGIALIIGGVLLVELGAAH